MKLDFVLYTQKDYMYETLRSSRTCPLLWGQSVRSEERTTVFIDAFPYGLTKFSTWLSKQDLTTPQTVVYVTRNRKHAGVASRTFATRFPAIIRPDRTISGSRYRAQPISFRAFLLGDSYAWLEGSKRPDKLRYTSAFLPFPEPPKPHQTEPVVGAKTAVTANRHDDTVNSLEKGPSWT